jgi:acyl-CoA thioester hydrolase
MIFTGADSNDAPRLSILISCMITLYGTIVLLSREIFMIILGGINICAMITRIDIFKGGVGMENCMEGYPVVIQVPVAWGEMDAFGHLNNIVYFRYFESARIAYFHKIGLIDMMTKTGIGPILASTSCKFKIPLKYPDSVLVGSKVKSTEEDRFMMGYGIFSTNHQKIAAEGDGLIVMFNYRDSKKVKVPEELRQRILALEATSER